MRAAHGRHHRLQPGYLTAPSTSPRQAADAVAWSGSVDAVKAPRSRVGWPHVCTRIL
jgi:hypothetical protein